MAALPWPLPREPPAVVRRLVQLITLPPILIGALLTIPVNTLDYVVRRPPYPLKRHVLLGVIRAFQNMSSLLRFVMPYDTEANVIPKAAAGRNKTEYAVRMVPPHPREDAVAGHPPHARHGERRGG